MVKRVEKGKVSIMKTIEEPDNEINASEELKKAVSDKAENEGEIKDDEAASAAGGYREPLPLYVPSAP